ncbi:MAG: sigma-70 family RNA polymerase sigma factor [Lachnospiraceae bacterium]|nr:sigma-70 family RNA polymerase sigma factor [Lachnospiraceae bacterium]
MDNTVSPIINFEQEKIFREYHDKVFGYIISRVRTTEDAEDLCQDVFTKVFKKFSTFDSGKAKIGTWIYSVARNTVIDYYRTSHVHGEYPEDLAVEGDIDDELLNDETLGELADALKKLPTEQMDIIVLYYYKGYTLKQISEKMCISYGSTKLRHKEALKKLRGMLKYS